MDQRFKFIGRMASASVTLIGILGIAGWIWDVLAFRAFLPGSSTMAFNTAAAFVLVGWALGLSGREPRQRWRVVSLQVCGTLSLVLGLLTLCEYLFGWNAGIDQLFHAQSRQPASDLNPSRMAPVTALNFTLIGLALMVFNRRALAWTGQLLASLAGFLGLLALLGYAYDIRAFYQVGPYVGMAIHTALGFTLMALAYLFMRPDLGVMALVASKTYAGTIARRLLPVAILVPAVIGWVRLLGEQHGLYPANFGAALFALGMMGVLTLAVLACAKKLYVLEAARKQADARIQQLNENLEQRNAELNAERQRWQGVVEGIADEVWVCDARGKMSLINLAGVTAMGLEAFKDKSVEEVLEAVEILTPDGQPRPPEQAPLLRSLRGEIVRGEEIMRHRRTGNTRCRQFSSAPTRAATGAITGAVAIVRDITGHKRAEDALRESEQRLRATFDHAAMGIAEMDAKDRYVAVNDRVCQILGYRREELLGMSVHELTCPEDQPRSDMLNAQLREGRCDQFDYEKRYLRRDGSPLWVHVTVSAVRARGRFLRAIGTIENISERKAAEEALHAAHDALTNTNQHLEQLVAERTVKLQETIADLEHFSYTITHDMRAPLRAMIGLGRMLIAECSDCLHPSRRDFLRRIAEAAERMDHLITDSLDYSKVMRQGIEVMPVDAGALLRGMVESYPQFQFPQAHIQIEEHIPTVLANEAGLTQCFSNFLGNAVKFVEPGKTPQVRVWAEERKPDVRLWFEDNGIGIEKEYQDKIWIMFQRLSKSYEGTGIGLALVRKITERMGGKVGVESEPGKGSRFWIELKGCR